MNFFWQFDVENPADRHGVAIDEQTGKQIEQTKQTDEKIKDKNDQWTKHK